MASSATSSWDSSDAGEQLPYERAATNAEYDHLVSTWVDTSLYVSEAAIVYCGLLPIVGKTKSSYGDIAVSGLRALTSFTDLELAKESEAYKFITRGDWWQISGNEMFIDKMVLANGMVNNPVLGLELARYYAEGRLYISPSVLASFSRPGNRLSLISLSDSISEGVPLRCDNGYSPVCVDLEARAFAVISVFAGDLQIYVRHERRVINGVAEQQLLAWRRVARRWRIFVARNTDDYRNKRFSDRAGYSSAVRATLLRLRMASFTIASHTRYMDNVDSPDAAVALRGYCLTAHMDVSSARILHARAKAKPLPLNGATHELGVWFVRILRFVHSVDLRSVFELEGGIGGLPLETYVATLEWASMLVRNVDGEGWPDSILLVNDLILAAPGSRASELKYSDKEKCISMLIMQLVSTLASGYVPPLFLSTHPTGGEYLGHIGDVLVNSIMWMVINRPEVFDDAHIQSWNGERGRVVRVGSIIEPEGLSMVLKTVPTVPFWMFPWVEATYETRVAAYPLK